MRYHFSSIFDVHFYRLTGLGHLQPNIQAVQQLLCHVQPKASKVHVM